MVLQRFHFTLSFTRFDKIESRDLIPGQKKRNTPDCDNITRQSQKTKSRPAVFDDSFRKKRFFSLSFHEKLEIFLARRILFCMDVEIPLHPLTTHFENAPVK